MAHNRGLHRITGLLVLLFVFSAGILGIARSEHSLHTPALILIGSLLLQVVLGAITIGTHKATISTTLHAACGAFALATCWWLTLNTFRIVAPRPQPRRIR